MMKRYLLLVGAAVFIVVGSGWGEESLLKKYYARRSYDGAPPVIPHEVDRQEHKMNCLSCHGNGGYSERFKAETPVTPHPEYSQCLQCHVPKKTETLFVASHFSGWQELDQLFNPTLPTAPPVIPHQAFFRKNCLSCHGQGGPEPILTPHPERRMCTQCHVYAQGNQKGLIDSRRTNL